MNKKIWDELKDIRKAFQNLPVERLTLNKYQNDKIECETELTDEFYMTYCCPGNAQYKDNF